MANQDIKTIAIVIIGGYVAYKLVGSVGKGVETISQGVSEIGSGFGNLFSGIGGGVLGIGSGVNQIGVGVNSLGAGTGLGIANIGAGLYQVGTGAGTLLGGAAPANIAQSLRQNPTYYQLPSAIPADTSQSSDLPAVITAVFSKEIAPETKISEVVTSSSSSSKSSSSSSSSKSSSNAVTKIASAPVNVLTSALKTSSISQAVAKPSPAVIVGNSINILAPAALPVAKTISQAVSKLPSLGTIAGKGLKLLSKLF